MLLTLLLTVAVIAAAFFLLPKTKGALSNTARGLDDTIANGLADPIRDGQIAIEDARKDLHGLVQTVAELLASNKQLKGQYDSAVNNVNKFENLAKAAGAAGNADDVRAALQQKEASVAKVNALAAQVSRNEALAAKLKQQIADYNSKIQEAESNASTYIAQIKGAEIRSKIAQRAQGFDASGLAGVTKLADAANKLEAEASAQEELAGVIGGSDTLEKKYEVASVSDADISKYLKA
jgi:phage shock protein A